jgi:ATP-dependent RNA helicase DDX47/RRP3
MKTFHDLGLMEELVNKCTELGFTKPTPIQEKSLPIEGDIIALAQTGSGKTLAFVLPMLQHLFQHPVSVHSLIIAPTRELALQIHECVEAVGGCIGVKSVCVVGGMDMVQQQIALSKQPHVVVCTPGRILDHLTHTKGFHLKKLQYLVMDEADRLLDLDFGKEIEEILKIIPRERRTLLFSATMTSKVEKLQRASLVNPVRVEVAGKYETVDGLVQRYMFVPFAQKETYFVYLVNEIMAKSMIVFTHTVNTAQRMTLLLRNLGFEAVALHGQLTQTKRLGALQKFKSGGGILVATDVASRGLDIPSVDVVVNYDVPQGSKEYIHRVGRTARAGRGGKAVTMVSQYDLEWYLRIETVLGVKVGFVD